jgi:hypothetical protein
MAKTRPPAKPKGTPTVTLKIPKSLYDHLTGLIEGTGFRSVTEFAIHVLRDVASGGKLTRESSGIGAREIEVVRQRLQALGYIEGDWVV